MAPTTSSTRPPSRWWARLPTPRSPTPTRGRSRPRRPPGWAATPAEERLALLKAAAGAIRAKNDELVPLVIAETGATASVGSRMQVPVCADRFDRYSRDIRHVQESMLPPIATAATPLAPGRAHQRPGLPPAGRAWWPPSPATTSP